MIRYMTNWMGPVSSNKGFCCGRIDVYGDDNFFPYNDEIGVPLIESDDWAKLTELLSQYVEGKRTLYSWGDVVNLFEKKYGRKPVEFDDLPRETTG